MFLSKLFEILGIVFIIYGIDWFWKIFYFGVDVEIRKFIIDILIFGRNLILGSVGIFFLNKKGYLTLPLYLNFKYEKENLSSYVFPIFISIFLLFLITIALLILSSSPILNANDINFSIIIDSINRSIIVATGEEVYFRLFLQSLLIYWFSYLKIGNFFSIIVVSLLWALTHAGIIESGGLKFIQIFLFGIILGILMYKRGFESCLFVHFIFNLLSYLFLGSFRVIS
ncbi:MAG: CPBP family intramembrane metalloprotease [Calditrichaceae bacterium]|nr:CPBP family intramembrane metalloprotease [Calditrichaceae bacterium]MBN2708943.1 CPBP family intramembrane metalloprotease [Calditrichaceae bacterium]RQV97534.1 MAG: CPBP family intramembrane metalloprotease [Calditrichota bacterium]